MEERKNEKQWLPYSALKLNQRHPAPTAGHFKTFSQNSKDAPMSIQLGFHSYHAVSQREEENRLTVQTEEETLEKNVSMAHPPIFSPTHLPEILLKTTLNRK